MNHEIGKLHTNTHSDPPTDKKRNVLIKKRKLQEPLTELSI